MIETTFLSNIYGILITEYETPGTPMAWSAAQAHCNSLGKNLITVNTAQKQAEIEAVLPAIGKL